VPKQKALENIKEKYEKILPIARFAPAESPATMILLGLIPIYVIFLLRKTNPKFPLRGL